MKMTVDPANPQTWPKGRINAERFDATTESELAAQQARDDETAMQVAIENNKAAIIFLAATLPR